MADNLLEKTISDQIAEIEQDIATIATIYDLGIIFLTPQLYVRRISPSIQNYLPIHDNCIGLNIEQIELIDKKIIETIRGAIQSLTVVECAIVTPQNEEYIMEAHPIMAKDNQNAELDSIMLVFSRLIKNKQLNDRLDMVAKAYQKQGVNHLQNLIEKNLSVSTLAKQKELFETTLTNMFEAIVVINDEGQIVMHNDAAKQISPLIEIGLDLNKWIEQYHFYVPIDMIDIAKDQNPFFKALHGGEGKNWELYMTTNGKKEKGIYLNISVQSLKVSSFSNGSIIVMRDITDRKQSEIELLNSELTQRALLYAIPDILFRANRDGIYLDYIPAKDAQIPGSAFISNSIADVIPSDIADELLHYIEQALDTGTTQTFTFEHTHEDIISHYEARIAPINQNEVMGIVRDVTDLIESQHTVRKTNENYRRLIELNPTPIALFRNKGEIIFINKSGRKMLGIPENTNLTDKTILDFVHRSHLLTVKTAIAQIIRGGYFDRPNIFKMITYDNKDIDVLADGSVITYNYELVVQIAMQNTTQNGKAKSIRNTNKNNNSSSSFDSTTNGILFFDAAQNIVDCNSCMVELLGAVSKEEIVAKPLFEFLPPFQSDGIMSKDKIEKVLNAENNNRMPTSLYWQFTKINSSVVDTHITLFPSERGTKSQWMAIVNLSI